MEFDSAYPICEGTRPPTQRASGSISAFRRMQSALLTNSLDNANREGEGVGRYEDSEITSREAYKNRTLAIAKGGCVPAKNDPKALFESLATLFQVLSGQNRDLLKLILKTRPRSLHELAEISGRAPSSE